ncbi:MAG: response regulator transcription factor [Caldilineaceae bacterium]|nr:response regulator transcription factor [Caldilineaceae bacterium]
MTDDIMQILIVDDHAILRSGLRLLIDAQPTLNVVGEAGSGADAVTQARALQPDLILLDLSMPDGDGLSIIATLRSVAPQARILILTMHDDTSHLRQALDAGASGYVLKNAVDQELLMAIRAVRRGETYVHSAMTQKLVEALTQPATANPADPWAELSEREFEVMKLVALGYTNAEIAQEIHLSVKTVESYRSRGLVKLGLETRAQLVQSALQHGHLE